MRLGLRRKYFLWLMLLTVTCTLFSFVADLVHDVTSGEFEESGGGLNLREETRELLLFLAASTAAIGLTAVVGWFIARRIAQPILHLADTARSLHWATTGTTRSTPKDGDEIADIAIALADAFRRYEALLGSARRFNAHAAHQLRAPLAAMRTMGECALGRPRSPEEYRETLTSMLDRTGQMACMVDRLLAYSELSISDCRQDFELLDIRRVVDEVCGIFLPLAEAKSLALSGAAPAALHVRGSFVLLVEMVGNLVDNAIRFTPAGGSVSVTAHRASPNRIQLVVDDNGAGMTPAQYQRVMDRFRTQASSRPAGTGLGLAIAAEIAALHEATIEIQPGAEHGTRVIILLPAAADPADADHVRAAGRPHSPERQEHS